LAFILIKYYHLILNAICFTIVHKYWHHPRKWLHLSSSITSVSAIRWVVHPGKYPVCQS